MSTPPFKQIHFDWLSEPEPGNDSIASIRLGDLPWTSIGLPPEYGTVLYSQHILALGMSFNPIRAEFSSAAFGRLIPGTVARVEFEEPTFQAVVLRGLRVVCRERFPAAHLAFAEGADLFRYTERYHSDMSVDGSYSGTCIIVSIRQTVLSQLIGEPSAGILLSRLNISQSPAIAVRSIPLHVSQHLVNGLTTHLGGSLLKLHLQANVLQYLAALVDYVCVESRESFRPGEHRARDRARSIHEQLVASDGKLPSLDVLAQQYGRSAKLLNEEFTREYGQSIFTFMVDFRLSQAHAALEQTDVSIKQLAARLGYTHVSNFTIAFKRKFGYPPGSLRKQR